jgi:hypothetical protein
VGTHFGISDHAVIRFQGVISSVWLDGAWHLHPDANPYDMGFLSPEEAQELIGEENNLEEPTVEEQEQGWRATTEM